MFYLQLETSLHRAGLNQGTLDHEVLACSTAAVQGVITCHRRLTLVYFKLLPFLYHC